MEVLLTMKVNRLERLGSLQLWQNSIVSCNVSFRASLSMENADSRAYFSWTMVSFLVRTLCLCLVLMNIFLSVSLCDHVVIKTDRCW